MKGGKTQVHVYDTDERWEVMAHGTKRVEALPILLVGHQLQEHITVPSP